MGDDLDKSPRSQSNRFKKNVDGGGKVEPYLTCFSILIPCRLVVANSSKGFLPFVIARKDGEKPGAIAILLSAAAQADLNIL